MSIGTGLFKLLHKYPFHYVGEKQQRILLFPAFATRVLCSHTNTVPVIFQRSISHRWSELLNAFQLTFVELFPKICFSLYFSWRKRQSWQGSIVQSATTNIWHTRLPHPGDWIELTQAASRPNNTCDKLSLLSKRAHKIRFLRPWGTTRTRWFLNLDTSLLIFRPRE